MSIQCKILKAVLLLRKAGNTYQTKEEQLTEAIQWYPAEKEDILDEWIKGLHEELEKTPEQKEQESREFCERLANNEAQEFERDMYYCPSSTAGDYGPGNPWDAPGMSISDFI